MENAAKQNLDKGNGSDYNPKNTTKGPESNLEKLSHITGKNIGAMASDFVHSASDYATTSRDFVKENPSKGVAIAAATGAVVGSLLTLALRRRP